MRNPCKNCEKRSPACWGSCEEYIAWKAEWDNGKAKAKEEMLVIDYQSAQIRRGQARRHKKTTKVVSSNAQK